MDKSELRRQMRRIRGSLTVPRILYYSSRIHEALLKEPAYQEADVVLAYMSFSSEVDTRFLIEHAWNHGKRVAVPKCRDGQQMDFYYITGKDQVAPGKYGIMEPTTSHLVDTKDGQNYICLLPGLAFNEKCSRLGYGGGYYDRFLSQNPEITRVMLAYELEKTDEDFGDSFDIPADIVLTEVNRYVRESVSLSSRNALLDP